MATAFSLPPAEPQSEPELMGIALICRGPVRYMDEAGRRYIHIVGLHFFVGSEEKLMDALLCMNYPNEAYPTKLYLPENVGHGLNWNEDAFILGRKWFTWSWKGVSPNQVPLAMLAGHLEAFR